MKMNWTRNGIILFCLLTAVFLISGSLFEVRAAGEDADFAFEEMIAGLEENGQIPVTSGTYFSLGDYEDSLAQMGYVRKIPLMEAENFVMSVHVSWESATRTPDTQSAGCGIIFNAEEGSSDHMIVSIRMNGAVYMTGLKLYTPLSYGKFYYGLPAVEGSAELMLILNNDRATVYLDNNYLGSASVVQLNGKEIGLGILSGTYQDFGTRCKFENIRLYTWQGDQD